MKREAKAQEKLRKIYEYISEYVNENKYPPSVREICRDLGIKSTATVYTYLEKLREMKNNYMK